MLRPIIGFIAFILIFIAQVLKFGVFSFVNMLGLTFQFPQINTPTEPVINFWDYHINRDNSNWKNIKLEVLLILLFLLKTI